MHSKTWFEDWFDKSYYHTLYQNRNEEEAERFIRNLVNLLDLDEGSNVLDLACGKGRHAITLSQYGYHVLGVDLSKNSIEAAKKFETHTLQFAVHDMRNVIEGHSFSAVFNLFTSFGYFDTMHDNERVLQAIHAMLQGEGMLVIDFMNSSKVISELVISEEKTVDTITFQIDREYNGTHILKHIRFVADGNDHHYTERVQALTKSDFETILRQTGFEIIRTFGDFDLNPFDEKSSDRLILIAKKKE
jgi:cyclopropane fatty-acyl-phospholipid synthase-like methyltransferase